MIGRRMANIIKRFARDRDDTRLANLQRVRGLDAEWKLLRCPTEYCLPNLTPLWANRNLGANRSDVASGSIFKRDVNVAVCFDFCVNDAASESIPLLLWAFALLSSALNLHPPLVLPTRKSVTVSPIESRTYPTGRA
jgi:hypothetical protein